jgi:hypothetical protein
LFYLLYYNKYKCNFYDVSDGVTIRKIDSAFLTPTIKSQKSAKNDEFLD